MNSENLDPAGVRATGGRLIDQWAALWSGEYGLAHEILAPGFRVYFAAEIPGADALRGPDEVLAFIRSWRGARPGLVFTVEGTPIVDLATGQVSARWRAVHDADRVGKSGIDQLDIEGDRITRIWSAAGTRLFESADAPSRLG
ncbi:nuclear transport factor 2 family protein [Amycolatopsis sp. QT-25]|uniref:nuclear transport factor 2 family protein n=1 Tax=Amycolatopsis sp. QT-25 TaxID=3034022 RepID=UPI0023EBF2E0|nr:nuclear transport factor 2 family protein [Amycolatopsis sp. QT-25]WET76733.1 nuclear transport factor 2 family protein [Amycolatopsis sp. QT-25]